MNRRLLALSLSMVAGCAPSTGARRDGGTGPDAGTLVGTDASAPVDAGPPRFDECTRDVERAETRLRPVDIVWIVDRSGSMSGEARIVQDNINGFARAIDASRIDYHVVMVSAMSFISVPPPLGDDPTRFLYVEEDVQSNDGLIDLVDRFADYSSFLRPEASTHFVVVTDDESERMSGTDFRGRMEGLLGHGFTLHAIASPPGSTHCEPPGFCFITEDGCTGPNGDAAENGDEYWALAGATGGQRLSICTADWSGLFSSLTAAIAVPVRLPCRFILPDAPEGMTLDRTKVNVLYTPTGAAEGTLIPYVPSGYPGCGASGGWYYEAEDIVVCPATCTILSGDASGRIDIVLGCTSVLI